MSQPQIIKVYGNFWPAHPCLAQELASVAKLAIPMAENAINLTGDLLTISFEGIFFPVDEIIAILQRHLEQGSQGKLDVIDLEEWRLTRNRFEAGKITQRSSPLNNVLAWSGH